MYTVASEDNRFEEWAIDDYGVALFGARRDAAKFGGAVTVKDDTDRLVQVFISD